MIKKCFKIILERMTGGSEGNELKPSDRMSVENKKTLINSCGN